MNQIDRLRTLLVEALQVPADERDAWVDARAANAEEADAVRRLLAAEIPDALERPIVDFSEFRPAADAIAGYRLEDVIGRGASSVVYRAEQFEPVRRHVAIKILSSEVSGRDVERRLRIEHHVLAHLDDHRVARVLDAGTLDDGRAWFAMDLVDGEPVDRWCEGHAVARRRRVELVVQVCDAVDHAHRRGILHRDLKPANILVSGDAAAPRVRLIDFGIARILEDSELDLSLATVDGGALGTPAYMSPEQARGESAEIDVRTDVFAIGVILLELVTGGRAHDADLSVLALLQRVARDPVRVPSHDADRRPLPRDLVAVLERAVAFRADDRYPNVLALRDDLERWLADRAVQARQLGGFESAWRFVRRNPIPVSLVLALVLILGTSTILLTQSSREQARATERARTAQTTNERVLDFVDEMFAAAQPAEEGADVTVVEVIDQALAQMQSGDLEPDGDVRAGILATLASTLSSLDRQAVADSLSQLALAHFDDAIGGEATATEIRVRQIRISVLSRLGRTTEALADVQTLHERLERYPETDAVRASEVADTWFRAGWLLEVETEFARADSAYAKALEIMRSSADFDRALEAEVVVNRVMVNHRLGRVEASIRFADEAESLFARLPVEADDPLWMPFHNSLAAARWQQGRIDDTFRHRESAIALAREIYGPRHSMVAAFLANYGNFLVGRGRAEDGIVHIREALEIWEEVLGPETHYIGLGGNLLGFAMIASGDVEGGEDVIRRLYDAELAAENPRPGLLQQFRSHLALTAWWRGDDDEARRIIDEVRARDEQGFYSRYLDPLRATIALRDGDVDAARSYVRPLVDELETGRPSLDGGRIRMIYYVDALVDHVAEPTPETRARVDEMAEWLRDSRNYQPQSKRMIEIGESILEG